LRKHSQNINSNQIKDSTLGKIVSEYLTKENVDKKIEIVNKEQNLDLTIDKIGDLKANDLNDKDIQSLDTINDVKEKISNTKSLVRYKLNLSFNLPE